MGGVGRPRLRDLKALIGRGLLSLTLIGASSGAFAADFLRGMVDPGPGPQISSFWQGFYLGGHAGYGNMTANFSGGVSDLVANILRNTIVEDEFHPSDWVNLPQQATVRPSIGGFVGYNFQFEDAVIGIEGSYNRTDMSVRSGDTIARNVNTSNGYSNDVTVSGSASVHLTDYGTARVRFGWAYRNLMPYAFAGFAIARATIARSASVSINGVDANPGCVGPPDVCLPPYSFFQSQTDVRNNAFAYGWTAGGGLDWALTSNIFVRGEVEYISIPSFYGSSLSLSTARVGAGLKF